MPSAEEVKALQQALAEATRQSEEAALRNASLISELRVAPAPEWVSPEHDNLRGASFFH